MAGGRRSIKGIEGVELGTMAIQLGGMWVRCKLSHQGLAWAPPQRLEHFAHRITPNMHKNVYAMFTDTECTT